MQIVKDDRNNHLMKDEEIHLKKMNFKGSMSHRVTKAKKTTLSLVRPFDGEDLWGITWPVDTIGIPAKSHATPSQKKRLGKGKGQGSDAKELPEGRTLM